MKITFIRPNIFKGRSADAMEPAVFSLLKSLSPKDVEFELFDERIEDLPEKLVTDIVCITVETFTCARAYNIAKEYKKQGLYIAMGGYHPTFMEEEALLHADTIFIGEAENTWGRFLEDYKKGKAQKVYRCNESVDISNIYFDERVFKGKKYNKVIPIQFGRGCLYSCEYCSIAAFYGKSQKFRQVSFVIDEIKRKKSKYLFITDDNLMQNREKTIELLKALIPLKIKWVSQMSIDVAKDDEMLALMKKSGCMAVLIGFETLNDDNLKLMKKAVNIKIDYENAVAKIHSKGIMIYGTFILGYDNDTKASFKKTLNFAIKNKLLIANFNPLMVMPGTNLYERYKNEGKLIYDKWWIDSTYRYGDTMFYPKNFSPKELADLCYETRLEFNTYRSIFKRIGKTNFKHLFIYLLINLINKKEIKNKQGAKLGE